MRIKDLKEYLDSEYETYNSPEFILSDPTLYATTYEGLMQTIQ